MTATYIALSTLTLTSTTTQVIFSSIPATYRDLVLVTSVASQNDQFRQYRLQVNGDASSNYNTVYMNTNGSSFSSFGDIGSIEITLYNSGTGTNFAAIISQFLDYSATNKHKSMLHRVNAADLGVQAVASRYANTNAITSIRAFTPVGQFVIGSTFSLYGIN